MSSLFDRKCAVAGFIVVDTSTGDETPAALQPTGLFERAKHPSFFRIGELSYKRTRNRLEKLIIRHYRILGELRSAPNDDPIPGWRIFKGMRVNKTSLEDLNLKIKSISHEILSAK